MDFSKNFEHPPPNTGDPNSYIKQEPYVKSEGLPYMHSPPPPPIAYPHCTNIKTEPQANPPQSYVPHNPYYGQHVGWWPPHSNGYNNCFKCYSPYFNQFWYPNSQTQSFESNLHQLEAPAPFNTPNPVPEQNFTPDGGGKIKTKVTSKVNTAKDSKKSISKPEKSGNKKLCSRKKIDRFDGLPEEEVARKLLPDHLDHNLDILIIGINPGLYAAHKGHHYAGPGNHFWKCLYLSGMVPEPYTSDDDYKMLQYKIGFTNMVARTTRGAADLSRTELKEGCEILLSKLKYYQPKIAVFNGKGMYEVFCGKKDFHFGKQPEKIDGTNIIIWVMPSSSARCAQLPRAADKVPFYVALKKLRDHLNGLVPHLDDSEIIFSDIKLKNQKANPIKIKKEEEHQTQSI